MHWRLARHFILFRRHAVPAKSTRSFRKPKPGVKEIETQYTNGLSTQGERYNKVVVDIWGRTGDQVAKVMMEQLGRTKSRSSRQEGQAGFLQLDLHDGRFRRPGPLQIRQLAGMRGPDGGQMARLSKRRSPPLPRGLNVLQYFISTTVPVRVWPIPQDPPTRLPDARLVDDDPGSGHHRRRLRNVQRRSP